MHIMKDFLLLEVIISNNVGSFISFNILLFIITPVYIFGAMKQLVFIVSVVMIQNC